ncbi:heavy metal translocating P-type ATPase, partial [Plesiomonas sp.]|uniref:heavy metal translocating P-type ATPase n=2 Tax=Plesiomonas sp. TaxID=2486279 RepID=UPI003F3E0089
LFLFAVAEKLEDMSLTRAGEAVKALMALAPETAWVRNSAEVWQEVAVAEVVIGSTVRVRPGERVPLDGQISRGVSHFNEAPITGESLPVSKEIGATVFAGSINGDGVVEVCTTASASSSVLARIISTVRDAQASKAPTQRFIDQFAKYYTPVVVMAAVLVAILLPVFGLMTLKASVYSALVMLVIACPCALVIATPVTLVSALASAARHGMLVKGGAPLEMAAKIKAVAFDKTGTLTVGEPEVTGILRPVLRTSLQTQSPEQAGLPAASILTEQNILALAAALDAHSTHPLARAVLNAASAQQVPVMQAQNIQELTGLGVQGSVDGQRYLLGSRRLAERTGVLTADIDAQLSEQEAQGQGLLLLMSEQAVLGIITVADKIRDEAQAVIQRLNSMGIHTVMLSGDHQSVATAVGNKIGVEQALGGLLPDDKLARIHALQTQYGHVAMIGDGVNDAPALAQADLGIAMGAAGSDTALETAGAALMEDKLEKLPDLFTHARRTANVLKANIVMALVIKAVFFALALVGIATLWMAVFADVGASLLVIANGLRLAKQIKSD